MRRPQGDSQARPDELGNDPSEVGRDSAGQSGDATGLSNVADANEASVDELAETGQELESNIVQGAERAADQPERPVHISGEDPLRRDDLIPPEDGSKEDAA